MMSARRSRAGSVLMEFIIVAPLMFLFISMILQFAHIWMARQMTAYAAYCATRAVLCVPPGKDGEEQKKAAENAAEMVLAWFSFVNLPGAALAGSGTGAVSSKTVHVGRLHDREDISADETVSFNDGLPYEREIMIPGWGGIPGSDSAKIRRKVFVINGSYKAAKPYAAVKVVFKFPLLMPMVGRMLSWFGGHPDEEIADDGRYHLLRGWNGDETVMDESGNLVSRSGARWGQDGRFPVITLTETCLLPMPYSTANFPTGGYADDLPRGGD